MFCFANAKIIPFNIIIAKNLENKTFFCALTPKLRGRLPIKLMYKEFFKNRSDATKREIFIKKMNKQEKIFLINTKNLI